ncbi:MAG: 3-phosphoserine/phosphohydroxythreonine transaminase [Saprospiraceae bacterium]|nr:3-phosphoserine/phosphohydroxythreonine transaminase [Saprospiraceae bacterium]
MKKYNFYAGPAILPDPVIKEAAEAVNEFAGTGLSILELSHRSKEIVAMMDEAEQHVYDLLDIDKDSYSILFLTGGASSQFFMTAINVLDKDAKAAYIDTGSWSTKAIKEAKHFGEVEVVASSKNRNYCYIPKSYTIPEDVTYVHYTSNNTIFGTEFHQLPETSIPLVSDMSSNIFSRPMDVSRHAILYAGAQKNLGPAGVTMVIVRNDILGKVNRAIPTMLNYQTHITKKSSFNTPPVFPIYVSMLTMRWLKANGGVSAMEKKNIEKANILYNEIDRNPLFYGTADNEDRSRMNVCFLARDEAHEAPFLEMCLEAGCMGVKGHRSVGGFRASIYNAMSMEGVQILVDVMKELERIHG